MDYSGYHECPCRDCFEISIGTDGNGGPGLCNECEDAGCDATGESECESLDAYESNDLDTQSDSS